MLKVFLLQVMQPIMYTVKPLQLLERDVWLL
jgi:hypothetical protein